MASAFASFLGFLFASSLPPCSEGSAPDAIDPAAFHDAPLHWTNVHSGDIILDTRIRDWVLIPILIIMILFTMIREHVGRLLHSTVKGELKTLREVQALQKAALLRGGGGWLPESSFHRRRAFFTDKEKGIFNDTAVTKVEKDPLAAMTDPNMMMQQQKAMITGMLPQMVMMGLISYFFSGFVMVKIPLPLSLRFKAMTQRGIELGNSLDVAFVSSFSWCLPPPPCRLLLPPVPPPPSSRAHSPGDGAARGDGVRA